MKSKISLIGLLLSCCLAGFSFKAQAQSSSSVEWKRYELGKGNFSVLFPSQPKEESTPSPRNGAVPIDLYTYSVTTDEGVLIAQYSVLGEAALTWSESAIESFYDGVWTGASEAFDKEMIARNLSYRAVLVQKRKIKFGGSIGREVVFTLGNFHGRILTTVIGRQTFGATVMGTDKLSPADRQKFLDSFIVTLKPLKSSELIET